MKLIVISLGMLILFLQNSLAQEPLPKHFNNQKTISHTTVKDQYYSSTCWSFATLSFLESEMIRLGKGEMDLSEMYVARFSYRNKIKEYLKNKGTIFFTPGGQAHDVIQVIVQYGIVPESAYSGLINNQSKHWHAEMDTLINQTVQQLLQQKKTEPSAKDWQAIDKIFDECIGSVPTSFAYKGKNYTPKTFADEYLGAYLNDYITLTSYSHHTDYQAFILEDKFNWLQQKYYNLPLKEWKEVIDYALQNNFSVAWNGDVTEKTFDFTRGIAYLPNSLINVNPQSRLQSFQDTSSKIDHLMHIIGTASSDKGEKYYLVKNSWGDYLNSYQGYLYMSEPYFSLKTVSVTLSKSALPLRIRQKLKL